MKFNRTAATAAFATVVMAGAYGFMSIPSVKAEEEHHEHPKLREADRAIAEAEAYLNSIPRDFHGHKQTCLKRLNEARVEISLVLADKE